jgi:hypothetical protein
MDERTAPAKASSQILGGLIRCLPSRYAPFAYGVVQAAVTTGIATAVATLRVAAFSVAWIGDWLAAWALAWIAMLPVVVLAAPLIQRAVRAITVGDGAGSDL